MPRREDYKLRPLEESDLEQVLQWRNSEHIRSNMYTDHIISWDEHQSWFEKINQDQSVSYHICEMRNSAIGLVYFTSLDWKNKKCFWGFYLGESDTPLGSGAVIEFIALEYIFEILYIRKLCCEVLSFNEAVAKLHKKFGFQQEGLFIKHVLKNNRYQDVLFLSLFQEDWSINKERISRLIFRHR
jgi:UDP-4-amino-4,6-dideoxy-N-acetyl-beta-L-altrosamine N-acetyltransferase